LACCTLARFPPGEQHDSGLPPGAHPAAAHHDLFVEGWMSKADLIHCVGHDLKADDD
jgi:hypothetical protein